MNVVQARAESLSLPENFFRNSGIRSIQFVKRIDLCVRLKSDKHIFLINQWDGSNESPAKEAAVSSKKSKKKKRVRGKKKSPQLKSQNEIESVVAQLIHDQEIDTLIVEKCSYPLAVKFKEKATLQCEDTVTNRFDFLIGAVKKSTSTKPILAVYEEQYSDEIMKKIEAEKWNCEVYEPKSFKAKKARRKPHAKEVIEDDHEE